MPGRYKVNLVGECFCGAVSYEISGPLRDARSCHCSRCRKAFSSPYSSYAEISPEHFRWLSGENLLTTYAGEEGYGLQFCSRCGSTLCGILDNAIHGITLGCLNGDPDIEIGKHIYVGSKVGWSVIPDSVPQFEEGPPE